MKRCLSCSNEIPWASDDVRAQKTDGIPKFEFRNTNTNLLLVYLGAYICLCQDRNCHQKQVCESVGHCNYSFVRAILVQIV